MKTTQIKWISLVLCATLIIPTSCDRDDDEDVLLGTDPTPFNLEFVSTPQNQMGDFAGNAMAVFNDKIWSFGGVNSYSDNSYTDGLWLSEDGMAWQSVYTEGTLTATGRSGHSLTAFGDRMYLIGGTDNSGTDLTDIWATYNGTTWGLIADDAPFGSFVYHKTAVLNDRLYIVGMKDDLNMHVWSTANGTVWVQESNDAFPVRWGFALTVYNNTLCVIGGRIADGTMTNEVWRSGDGRFWPPVIGVNGLPPAVQHTAITYNGRVIVIGGATSLAFTNKIYYSEDLTRWVDFDLTNPMGISSPLEAIAYHCSLTTSGGCFWVFGGLTSIDGTLTGAIWRFKEI